MKSAIRRAAIVEPADGKLPYHRSPVHGCYDRHTGGWLYRPDRAGVSAAAHGRGRPSARTACTTAALAACRPPRAVARSPAPTVRSITTTTTRIRQPSPSHYVPTHDGGQISQVINGTVTIDDNGTPAGTDDLHQLQPDAHLSAWRRYHSLYWRQGGGQVHQHDPGACAAEWSTPPRANAFGGYDYVIGSEGFPALLTFNSPTEPEAVPCAGQLFGSMDCRASFSGAVSDPDRWSGSDQRRPRFT